MQCCYGQIRCLESSARPVLALFQHPLMIGVIAVADIVLNDAGAVVGVGFFQVVEDCLRPALRRFDEENVLCVLLQFAFPMVERTHGWQNLCAAGEMLIKNLRGEGCRRL